jgi:hypothetical protein
MKQSVDLYTFRRAFESLRPDNFSYQAQEALFDYLEEYEESSGVEIELDVIALCCEYTEYESLAEFQKAYGDGETYETIEDIEQETTVIRVDDDSFIIQDF